MEENKFTFVKLEESAAEHIAAPHYSYWKSVFRRFFSNKVAITMLIIAFWLRDDDDEGYWQNKWDSALCAYRIVFAENEDLTETYRLLKWLGYEMSTEEEQMYKGTHKIFTHSEEQNGNM